MGKQISNRITIAIDAMSGDHGLATTVPAALEIAKNTRVQCLLVGKEAEINASLEQHQASDAQRQRIEIVSASEVVDMDEKPALALRKKKDSSMRVAIDLVKEGRADACVSAGNTGALMATARFVLKMIPGIDRPAIASDLPRENGWVTMLDLGANVDTPPENLLQFGLMGSALVSCVHNKPQPTVALLNIGEEDVKGSDLIREAAELFKQSNLNYIGFVEGDDIFLGNVDVIVCDGFVGNVSLKTTEGVAQMISSILRKEFKRNILTLLVGLIARPVLSSLRTRVDPRKYNGASLLGINGVVVKSHGGTDAFGFEQAIKVAIKEAEEGMIEAIRQRL